MQFGQSWTIHVDGGYQARIRPHSGERPDVPMFVHAHARNSVPVKLSWVLPDGREAGAALAPGRTADLRDWWADGWLLEESQ